MYPLPGVGEDSQFAAKSLLGSVLDRRLADKGRWCVYVRADHRIPCVCFDPETQESSNFDCPYCFGLGQQVSVEKVKTHISFDVRKTYSTRSGISPAYVGDIDSTSAVAYFRGGFLPGKRDLLFETEWDMPYGRVAVDGTPTRLTRPWRLIRPAQVINGTEGKVDLWICGLENYGAQITDLDAQVRAIGPRLLPPGAIESLTPEQVRPFGGVSGNRYGIADVSDVRPKNVYSLPTVANLQKPNAMLPNFAVIFTSSTIVKPSQDKFTYYFDTSSGNLSDAFFGAVGGKNEYTLVNTSVNSVTLAFPAGNKVSGLSSLTIPPLGSMTIVDFAANQWSVIMSFSPNSSIAGGVEPLVPITVSVTLSMPEQDTRYPVTITAATTVTLPAATGSGTRLYFDLESLDGQDFEFALHGSDSCTSALPALVTGASLGFADIAAGVWALE